MTNDTRPQTKERLLRSAIEVFAEHGYQASTVREICRRADANVAAVNYYFGDKKHLYAVIFDTVFERLRKHRTPFLPPTATAPERLKAFIRSFFEEIFYCDGDAPERTQMSAMYLMEMARPTEVLDRVVSEHMRHDADELYSIVSALLDNTGDPLTVTNTAASVIGQVLYYYHARPIIKRLHPDLPPVEQRIDSLVEHVLAFSLGGMERIRSKSSGNRARVGVS